MNFRLTLLLVLVFLSSFLYLYLSPRAIIVPHHNIVASTRTSYFQKIKFLRPFTRQIIIIGPDHFSVNQRQISYTDADWSLPDTKIFYDHSFDASGLLANNYLVKNDHTIYNLLPDIKKYFPRATLVPILLGQKLISSDLDSLFSKITSYCHFDCLLIASVDFSHYLPASLADVHDAFTADALNSSNLEKIFSAEVDSPQSLYLISRFAKEKKIFFSLSARTNSGTILKNPDIETTTHFFGSFSHLFFKKYSKTTTKLKLPFPVDRPKNLSTLGDRFFYGVDEISSVPNDSDFAISTIEDQNQTIKSFFPLRKVGDQVSFVRGDQKTAIIKNYFDSLTDLSITKDYFWGKLIYESNH
jgi:MEMO1 family protein